MSTVGGLLGGWKAKPGEENPGQGGLSGGRRHVVTWSPATRYLEDDFVHNFRDNLNNNLNDSLDHNIDDNNPQ